MKNLFDIFLYPALSLVSLYQLFNLRTKENKDNTYIDNSRILYDSDGTLYLVDNDGNQYEPYSVAWRYLGMYLDCGNYYDDNHHDSHDGGGGDCYRRVLWAAYIDPRYSGGSIGEYQYYNISTGEWDKSTCKTRRCARMDCHEPNTHFKLLGVYKENDGLYDFAEQLFKHQGYCLWDEDTYDFMSEYRENWPSSCTSLYFYDYGYGYRYLYYDMMPMPFGNFTYGIYEDESCTTLSDEYNASTYIRMYYYRNGYDDDGADEMVAAYESRQSQMNEYMSSYKICQPCRAYSKYANYQNDDKDEEQDSHDSGDHLDEGGGYEEQWGFNCYDDAGYRNCNQCYKFQTKTDMEAAQEYDLQAASNQGSILEITVNGKVYGSGGYRSPAAISYINTDFIFYTFSFITCFCITVYAWSRYLASDNVPQLFLRHINTFSDSSIDTESMRTITEKSYCSEDDHYTDTYYKMPSDKDKLKHEQYNMSEKRFVSDENHFSDAYYRMPTDKEKVEFEQIKKASKSLEESSLASKEQIIDSNYVAFEDKTESSNSSKSSKSSNSSFERKKNAILNDKEQGINEEEKEKESTSLSRISSTSSKKEDTQVFVDLQEMQKMRTEQAIQNIRKAMKKEEEKSNETNTSVSDEQEREVDLV